MKRILFAFPGIVRKGFSALLVLLLCFSLFPVGASADDGAPLVVGSEEFRGVFSPFFSTNGSDTDISDLIQMKLMYADRTDSLVMKGSGGFIASYAGTRYTYYTPADCEFTKNDDGTYSFDFTLRDDLVFSDGEPLTVDDVIFTMYVLSDPSYDGNKSLAEQPILGLEEYRNGKADFIEGIQKIDDTHLRIVTTKNSLYRAFSVAPLHYYGDPAQYDYENHRFGFPKGDLSMIGAKNVSPLGAGPYRFVSFENGTVTLEANPFFFRGEPKTKTVIFKTSPDARTLDGILSGTVDITSPAYSKEVAEAIKSVNGNERLYNGPVIVTRTVDNLGYGYIGINANLVKVGDDPGSEESKALRKAFATIFSVYRDDAAGEYYGDTASVINYPLSNIVWGAPKPTDAGYHVAFSTDVNGKALYNSYMKPDQKYAAALQAALGFFEKAGYTVEDGKLTAAPEGAFLEYTIAFPGDGMGHHPAVLLAEKASPALESIGMKLIPNDMAAGNKFWDLLDDGALQMWAAAFNGGYVSGLYSSYYADVENGPTSKAGLNPAGGPNQGGDNVYFGIADPELDQKILEARMESNGKKSKALYKEVMEMAQDWAVEIPFYQRLNATLFSAERVNVKTIPGDITSYYDWMNEIDKIAMQ